MFPELEEPGAEVLLEPVGMGTIPVECEAVELLGIVEELELTEPESEPLGAGKEPELLGAELELLGTVEELELFGTVETPELLGADEEPELLEPAPELLEADAEELLGPWLLV
mgnify:FL=1